MTTRKNFPSRVRARREVALDNLKATLSSDKLGDIKLTAKDRKRINGEITILEGRIKGDV